MIEKKEKLKEKELIKVYRKNKNREKIKIDKQNKKEKVKEKKLVKLQFLIKITILGINKYLCYLILFKKYLCLFHFY